jgi:hypothetical protein
VLWFSLIVAAYPLAVTLILCVVKGGALKEDPRFEGDKLIYRS